MIKQLNEDSRQELISRSKSGDQYKGKPGENRFTRRVKSRISNSTKEFNQIDMNKFFKDDILDIKIKVQGETGQYLVSISFGDILEKIQDEVKKVGKFDARIILRALLSAFNSGDVYIRCDCPDAQYRMNYWQSVDNIIAGLPKEGRPSDETNPDNTLGSCCKHVALVLNNTSWLMKVCSVIVNYSHYMESHYKQMYIKYIYPAIYGEEWTGDKGIGYSDKEDEMGSDTALIDKANEYGGTRGQFKPGNKEGVRFAPKGYSSNYDTKEYSPIKQNSTNYEIKDYQR